MVFRPLTLLADWMDTAGGMVVAIPWMLAIWAWPVIEDGLALCGKIGGKIVLVLGVIGMIALSVWMFSTGVPRQIGGYIAGFLAAF